MSTGRLTKLATAHHRSLIKGPVKLDKFLHSSELYPFRWSREGEFVSLFALYNPDAICYFLALK